MDSMRLFVLVAVAATVNAGSLSLQWKDCGDTATHAKITAVSPTALTLGTKTTITGTGNLDEDVAGATYEMKLTGASGFPTFLDCKGDASAEKSCPLPLGTGTLTFDGLTFPMKKGTISVNLDLTLSASLPAPLQKTKLVMTATSKTGDKLFCIEVDTAPAATDVAIDGTDNPVLKSQVLNLVTFDSSAGTTFEFQELNDPVMGGKSTGTWHVDAANKVGVFDGDVANVPSLKAPGFIKSAANGKFADVSSAINGDLVLNVRTSTPDYKGFRVAFVSGAASPAYSCAGGGSLPFSRGCFKASFSVPAGNDFTAIRIPFKSFSDKWSPATGEQTKTCAEDADVCPTAKKLAAIQRIEVWAEGALGHVHLEVKDISAQDVSLGKVDPTSFNTCNGPIQANLRYNISSRTQATIPVPVGDGETLAEAVCCDSRTKVFAEPQFLYQAPDISLFSHLKGVTTFYDPVCGLPLFRAPMNRTMAEFQADTDEHGWPSFRSAEVVAENVHTEEGGFVYSKCGTHLGSFLPDANGARWCMDLSCVSGNPAKDDDIMIV